MSSSLDISVEVLKRKVHETILNLMDEYTLANICFCLKEGFMEPLSLEHRHIPYEDNINKIWVHGTTLTRTDCYT